MWELMGRVGVGTMDGMVSPPSQDLVSFDLEGGKVHFLTTSMSNKAECSAAFQVQVPKM